MADNNALQLNWLREVLGVAAESDTPQTLQKFGFSSFTEALSDLGTSIMTMFSDPVVSKRAQEDLEYQNKALETAKTLENEEERVEAVARIDKRLKEIKAHCDALETARKEVMGDSKKPPTTEQRSKIYAKALETHYGMAITIPEGMSNTHLDRVFDMMGAVPKSQVDHAKAKKLEFKKEWGSSGAYGGGTIKMGDFGWAWGSETYEVDGKKLPANSFDVTMLHEMGHALDDKESIMATHQHKDACGGWKAEDLKSVVTVMFQLFMNSFKPDPSLTTDIIVKCIVDALRTGIPAKPEDVDDDAWNQLVTFVADKVVPSSGRSEPWFTPPPPISGRCYLESYTNHWWSYSHAAVSKTRVNDYQWRSPGEWFAEVYAISWLKRTPPPSAVDAAVAAYMWQA